MLVDNFRSHPSIVALFNPTYANRLVPRAVEGPASANDAACLWSFIRKTYCSVGAHATDDNQHRAAFIHCDHRETREEDSPSWLNMGEAQIVTDLVKALPSTAEVVVLSPYAKQVKKISGKFHFEGIQHAKSFTVEMFQGREAPIIILSCVRSKQDNEIAFDVHRHLGFLNQPQRLNVAISRPKSMLVIVGNLTTLCRDPQWKALCKLMRNHIFASSATALTVSSLESSLSSVEATVETAKPLINCITDDEVIYSRMD